MPIVSIVLALHVLAATFWAGSTFTLARIGGKGAGALFGPQMGAAVTSILAGGYLWHTLFAPGGDHKVLGAGALAAIGAMIVQAVVIGRVRRRIENEEGARARALLAHRVAGGLLAVSIVCMVVQ